MSVATYTFRIRFNLSPHNTIETHASELKMPVSDERISVVLKAPQTAEPESRKRSSRLIRMIRAVFSLFRYRVGTNAAQGRVRRAISDSDQLILVGEGYASEQAAKDAGLLFTNALMVALARVRIGADFGQRAAKGAFAQYGLEYFGRQTGYRVLNNGHGLMVFPSEPKPRFFSMNAQGRIGTSPEAFHAAFLAAIERRPSLEDRDVVALTLFNASFFQPTSDSRFVLLVMAVEVLIETAPRSREACQHVDSLIQQTKFASIPENEKASMIGTLGWLRRESINQAGKRLISARLPGGFYDGRAAPDFFSDCYILRSNLVHGNLPIPTFEEVGRAAANMEVLVSDLLTSHIVGHRE